MKTSNKVAPKKTLSKIESAIITTCITIFGTIVGIAVCILLCGILFTKFLTILCIAIMMIISLTLFIIQSNSLCKLSENQRKFIRFYSFFVFLAILSIFFIKIENRNWFYRVPFSFLFISSIFSCSTSVLIFVFNSLNMTLLKTTDTLITKLAFDMLIAIPLGFSFGFLTKSVHGNFTFLVIVFSLVPFVLYIFCGIMITAIDKNRELLRPSA